MKVRAGGDGMSSPFFTPPTEVAKPTLVPFIFGGAWAFALTCKPLEPDFDFPLPTFAVPSLVLFAPESGVGEDTGKNAEVAAVATMMN